MNSLSDSQSDKTSSPTLIRRLFSKLAKRIDDLFEPEEVEVTFKKEGNSTTYTYTKVNHKQVA